ncbi:g4523 [Coccomyxa elongata]
MDQAASQCPLGHSSELSLPAYQIETSMTFGHLGQGALANQSRLSIPSFEEASFLEVAESFSHDFPEMMPIKPEPRQPLGEMQQGSDVLAHNVQRDTPVSQGQGPLETLMCPASIDKLLGEVVNDVPFPDLDLSGTWDMGMQMQPHFFMPQQVDEMPPIPDIMPGVDLPADGDLLPLHDLSTAEMPPNVTVTLKGRRSKQHASLGHLTKVMRPMNGPDRPPLHASAAGSREIAPGRGPGPRMHLGARLHRHASDVTMAGSPAQPPPRRQRSAPLRDHPPSQQHDRILQEQPRPGPIARLHDRADRPAEAAGAATPPVAPALKRRRLEDASEGWPAVMEEEPQQPQRKLRRRGDIPERLAAILENERSPSSEDSGEKGERSGSYQGASPSAVTGCKLSKAACRAQGVLHQLTEEEVMEVEAKLSPGATEEERTAAYRRARNRSAARKTRKRKVETVQELQEHMQTLGQQNRELISQLNNLLTQVEVSSRENATLKGLLRYLQLQPDAVRRTPSLVNLEALKNDMVSTQHDSATVSAPNQAPGSRERAGDRGQGPPPTKSSLGGAGRSRSGKLSDSQVQEMAAAALAASEGNVTAAMSELVNRALNSRTAN